MCNLGGGTWPRVTWFLCSCFVPIIVLFCFVLFMVMESLRQLLCNILCVLMVCFDFDFNRTECKRQYNYSLEQLMKH